VTKLERIGDRLVGPGQPCFIIGEIGINHNGSVDVAKKLIDAAAECGCDAVKFQKRTIEIVFTPKQLAEPRESPFGATYGDAKRGLEFGYDQYAEIDEHCRKRGILWSASCWDEASVDFIEQFNPPFFKIASACLTDDALLRHMRTKGRLVILSTGMSTDEEIQRAVSILGVNNLILLHCTSSYPAKLEELNLMMIKTLQKRYECPIGYSGHEVGLYTSLAAIVLGACVLERHITLDRAMWGTDQAASVEIGGLRRLVRDIRSVELALGDGIKRVYAGEIPVMARHRRVGAKLA